MGLRVYLLTFAGAVLASTWGSSVTAETTATDAVVVLGHRPARDQRGAVDYEVRARVEHAVDLMRAGRAPKLLVAGGESVPGVVEADVMAAYAASLGIDAAHVLRERASRDTIENARFSVSMLRALTSDRAPRIVLVTSDYHIRRAARLFRCAGAVVEESATSLPELRWTGHAQRRVREWFVAMAYWFADECARARVPGKD